MSANLLTLSRVRLQALLLADTIYQDRSSGKFVIAGTFHTVNVASFPCVFGRTVGAFVSLAGGTPEMELVLSLIEPDTGAELTRSRSLMVPATEGEEPIEFAVELPPFPLPRPGRYLIRLSADGLVLGSTAFTARGVEG